MQTPASPIPLRAACLTNPRRADPNNEDHFLDLEQRLFLVSDAWVGITRERWPLR